MPPARLTPHIVTQARAFGYHMGDGHRGDNENYHGARRRKRRGGM
jgi:hypothetical protein